MRNTISTDILYIIKDNIDNNCFCVIQLSEKLHISPSYLREIVWKKYNMSPQHLIETIRLDSVLNHIAMNNKNIYQICRIVGYDYPKTLRRAFKRRLNITPSECKKLLNNCKNKKNEINNLLKFLWFNNKYFSIDIDRQF